MRMTQMTAFGFIIALAMEFQAAAIGATEPVIRELPGPENKPAVVCAVYAPDANFKGTPGLVVHLYGSGGTLKPNEYNVGQPSYAEFRKVLAARGMWLVVPDLGRSPWMSDAACSQVDAVIAAMIQQEKVDPARVHLLGTSMGGGSSLIYVMRRPGKIKSVVSVFPMTDFTRWLEERPGYRPAVEAAHQVTDANRAEVLKSISPLQHPAAFRKTRVFLLHGGKDTVVKPEHSRDFAAALQAIDCPVIYREAADETHRDEIAQTYQQELADFLTKAE